MPPSPVISGPAQRHNEPARGTLRSVRWLPLAAELAAIGFAVSRLVIASRMPAAGDGEAWRVARVVAMVRLGPTQTDTGIVDGLVHFPLAAWVWATAGLDRNPTALAAVREAALVASIVLLLLTWLVARRLDLAWPARVAMVLIVGGIPATGAILAGTVSAAPLAAACLCAAVLLYRPGGPWTTTVLPILATAVALVATPGVIPALLVGAAVYATQDRPEARIDGRALITISAVASVAALLLTVPLVTPGDGFSLRSTQAPPEALPHAGPVELVLLAALAGTALAAAVVPWLRATAAAFGVLLATAVVDGAARFELLGLAVPLLAVLATAVAVDLVGRLAPLRDWQNVFGWTGGLAAAPVAAVLVVAAAVSLAAVPTRTEPADAAQGAADWLRSEAPSRALVAVDDAVWPELLRVGVPADSMRFRSRLGSENPPPEWFITAAGRSPPQGGGGHATPIARFGSGPNEVTVSRFVAGGSATDSGIERRHRAIVGAALADNPRLRLPPAATAALRRGDVDVRLCLVLADMAGRHSLTIAGFPVVPGELPGRPPMRRALITQVDGRPVEQPGSTDLVRRWLDQQLEPYRPRAVRLTPGGLLIRYAYSPHPAPT